MESATAPKVLAAIVGVMADLGTDGIGKNRTNTGQNYKFRGIDDVYNALNQSLVKNRLVIIPRILNREATVDGKMRTVVLEVEFDVCSADDGSKTIIRTYGEANDSADKATNKAMSAAYKYAALMAFCIPTEGLMEDADASHPEISPTQTATPTAAKPKPTGDTKKPPHEGTVFLASLVPALTKAEGESFKAGCAEWGWDAKEFAVRAKKDGCKSPTDLFNFLSGQAEVARRASEKQAA